MSFAFATLDYLIKNVQLPAAILYKEQVKAPKEARAAALEAKRKAEQHQRQFRAALLVSKKAQKALEAASRIATKKTAEAREEFRKAEDQAASPKALATAAKSTVEASTVIFEAETAHSKALIAAAKKVGEEVNMQVEVDDDEQSNSSDSEVSNEDVGMDIGNVVQSIK